ncbi:mechanosensitive ion channel family protein [Sphingomonas sp. 28-63-12]|uniref:mechanosensitive ion channel family protein n=1 Tax=Sphingomonas sp. 28-63-12 TaxID=1970434 RepID=UPI000BCBE3A8|nr:MAG: mechanosensitive ion channel protein MscS [Sphingomonas sp. 28-63-12]
MKWNQWLQDMGLLVPAGVDLGGVISAMGIVLGGYLGGWVAGRQLDKIVGAYLVPRLQLDDQRRQSLRAAMTAAISAVMLVVALQISPLATYGLAIVAVATGIAVGQLVFAAARLFAAASALATALAVSAGVIAIGGALGGIQPLIDGLDAAGITVSRHRLSLLTLVNAVLVVGVLFAAARLANRFARQMIGGLTGLDPSQRVLVQKLTGIGIVMIAGLLGLDLLGIDLTALAVFSGALGLAVGFGLQKTLGNLIAGLILLMDRSIKPGDVIVVGDTFGAVNKIGVRAVSVVTRDGKEHLIPNEQLMTEAVENWSYSSRNVRLHIPVGVSYTSDITVAQRLMIEAATAAARVLAEPAPSVWLKGFGDSSVDHDVMVWIADPELGVGNVQSDILNRIWKLFAANGIEIPFPQRDIHIRSLPSPAADGSTD